MSLIIVKLKLQMCKFRKGVLVFKIKYHVTKQQDYISILYIFRYRRTQSFGDKVSNYSCHNLMHWSFLEEIPIITYRNNLQILNISKDRHYFPFVCKSKI